MQNCTFKRVYNNQIAAIFMYSCQKHFCKGEDKLNVKFTHRGKSWNNNWTTANFAKSKTYSQWSSKHHL
jgi:hypothetical protein